MSDPYREPGWFGWFSRRVLRLGPARATAGLTLIVLVLALAIGLGVVMLAGRGERMVAFVSASVCALVLTPLVGSLVLRLVFELEHTRTQLSGQAIRDELMGVHNRRHFMVLADRELARARRYELDSAVLLIDADHFNRVNDTHGRSAGDALLRQIARVTGQSLRGADVLGRFAGEELIVFLPHTDPLGALDVAERIREHVGALRMVWQGQAVGTTVSVGVAALGLSHVCLDALIHDADVALYEAKAAGRNCVRAAPIQPRRSGETHRITSN
jgi:diguanylate cyclase (GGDEF)-like protein